MINITIEEIFDRLFNELKTEYKSIEPRKENFNGMEIIIPQEIIKKKNLKFIRQVEEDNITYYSILANEKVIYSGYYSSAVKEEYNYEETILLNRLWEKLETSFELRKQENISNKYEKICKALKGE